MVKYKNMTSKELAEYYIGQKEIETVDFTFDIFDEKDDCFEPSGWYGIEPLKHFDSETEHIIGYYGGGFSMIVDLETDELWNAIDVYVTAFGEGSKTMCVAIGKKGGELW